MQKFFQERSKLHQKKMQRYLKYVINDHFALTMTFLVGGIGLYYSNTLKTLPENFTFGAVLVGIIWLATLQIGQFTSLAKPADVVFLLPKERQMREYLTAAFKYSCYFPFGVLILASGAMMPLVVVATGQSFSTFLLHLLSLWALKLSQLLIERMSLFQEMEKATKNASLLWWMISIGTLALNLFIYPAVGFALAIAQIFLFYNLCWKKMSAPLDWEKMVDVEQHRLYRLYRFFNLFTDVPEIRAQIKRRKGMDGLLKRIPYNTQNTYLYLYARRLVRGTEYSNLYLRLAILGGVLLAFIPERWFALAVGSLFIYLIGFQLLPLYNQFQYVTITQLYPITSKQKIQAMQKLLSLLLLFTALLFSVISFFVFSTWLDRIIVIASYFMVTFLFLQLYMPYRLKKMAD